MRTETHLRRAAIIMSCASTLIVIAQQISAQQFQFGLLQTSSQASQQQQQNLKQYSGRTSAGLVSSGPNKRQPQQHNLEVDSATTNSLDNVIESVGAAAAASPQQVPVANFLIGSTADQSSTSDSLYSSGARPYSSAGGCQLPPTWAGRWYQANGREPIRVTNTEISDKGVCRDQKGDKYLFETTQLTNQNTVASKQHNKCLVCLVINERHLNVLQYKESSCQPAPSNYIYNNGNNSTNNYFAQTTPTDEDHKLLDSICNEITGDAQLESLFRLDTPSIECPISGKYSFTYDTCHEAQSSLDSCIDKKQLNFKYSACPDVAGSESKSEVLKCYADWSEGNNYYMIGRLEHASNHQDKGKFRCFVYEKSLDGKFIQMAQSLEESCYGLINANEGPKTLRLAVKPPTTHKCHFPAYIQSQSESWLSVDNSLIYMFDSNSTRYQVKETSEGNVIEEASCLQQFVYPQPTTMTTSNVVAAGTSNTFAASQHPALTSPYSSANINPLQQQQNARTTSSNQAQQVVKRFPSHTYPPQADLASQTTSRSTSFNDIVYLVQITKNCQTKNWCVRFYRRSNGIVQIDYFESTPNSDNQCRNAFIGSQSLPRTQVITSTNLEHQRCPFEGAYTIEAPLENDAHYNPLNLFMCPRQSFLTAQCDLASRLKIHYRCSPAKSMTKNLYCLGSWTTTDGFVRVLLADDERHRYSAWFRDYSSTYQLTQQDLDINNNADQSNLQLTRSQQLLTLSQQQIQQQPTTISNQIPNTFPSIVDLKIALITPLSVPASKPMQVRLTRRSQCADLRSYLSTGALGSSNLQSATSPSSSSSFMASYSAPESSSAASSSSSSATFVISQYPILSLVLIGSLLSSLIVISYSISRSAINNCVANHRAPAAYHSPASAAAVVAAATMSRPVYAH